MTFETLLERCRLRKGEFARLLGLSPGTVSRWKGDAPAYALAYLNLLLKAMARGVEP